MVFKRVSGVIAVLVMLVSAPALAEVVITLKNGVKITVPVNREDIATIELDGDAAPVAAPEKAAAAPASRPVAPSPKRQAPEKQAPPKPEPSESKPEVAVAPEPRATQPKKEAPAKKVVGLPEGSSFRSGAFVPKRPDGGPSRVVRIGPGLDYERPSEYARDAMDGDLIEIEGGTYIDDFAVWKASNITLRGVNGRPHLKAEGSPSNGKAIWVFAGDFVTVENIEFSGAKVRDMNGGGIRYEGLHLTVRDSYFHHNQTGIMTVNRPGLVVEIENSEFAHRIPDSGRAHAIYIGTSDRLTVRNSYFHNNNVGHQIKTRAAVNEITYNRIVDEEGSSSYLIDLSNCGTSYIIGNVLQQSRRTENYTAITYGPEGCKGRPKGLYVINNTFINDRHSGNFLKNYSPTPAVMKNNIVVGGGRFVSGNATEQNNVIATRFKFRDRDAWDLRPMPGSAAVDAGTAPGMAGDFDLTPKKEPGFPDAAPPRQVSGAIDAGAFEATSN
ncbi:MAG: right-handed parallel beta-helix repeat-containing protein [Alphaproteobacteria bacterium]